ncbi:MAG: serine/threonine protein kinase [Planctomycetes bacterium]|nr:serine/threonine protein kinase [Planctomycetota bacterium]
MKICLTCEGILDRDDARCAHCGGPLVELRAVLAPIRRGDDETQGPLVGRVVDGKYRVVGVLGRGGMGTVYRAVHEVSLVAVALKVLHPRWAARADFRAWFLAEARKAGRVLHEGTARVLDVGASPDGTVYLAVELVEGQTLAEWLSANEPVDPALVVDLLEQIARAMAAAHGAMVVHRDLSPRNVMVVQREDRLAVKVLDFGIAVQPPPAARSGGPIESGEDSPSGFANPPYSAPEHLAGRAVDPRADLYSLGVIAYEALSGELPVAGSTARELARETLDGRIRPLRARAGVPRELQRLVMQLVRLDPDERPASALLVAERLHRLLQPRRRALATIAVATFALAVVAAVLAYAPDGQTVFLDPAPRAGARALTLVGNAGVDVLRSSDVQDSRFAFGGFRPAELEIMVDREGLVLGRRPLGPIVEVVDGMLGFSPKAVPFIADLARLCEGGQSVDITFLVPGRAPIGRGRLLIDDLAPTAALRVPRAIGSPDALRGEDLVEIDAADVGGLASLTLEVERVRLGVGRGELVEVELRTSARGGTARELLLAQFPGVRSSGPCVIRLRAVDRAGNVELTPEFAFADLDLGAPAILEVGGPGAGDVVVQDSAGATLRFRIAESEPGLKLLARAPGAAAEDWTILPVTSGSGDRLDAVLPASRPGALAPSGRWAFRLVDPVGNPGEIYEEDLVVRSADPAEVLRPAPRVGADRNGIAEFDRGFVADRGPWRMQLRVDPLYRPLRCSITRADGAVTPVALEDLDDGAATIAVERIEPGEWQLLATVYDARRAAELDLPPRTVRVLEGPLELNLPAVADDAFLGELVEQAVLEVRDATIAQGAAWELRPADARLVRGRIWTRIGEAFVARELGVPSAPLQSLLPPVSIGRGWHELLLEFEDVLGRPVRVRIGARDAATVIGPGAARLARVARFFAHDAPLRPAQPVAMFEFGQPLRITLASELPARVGHPWRLLVGETSIAAARVEARGAGEELRFVVPFEVAAAATDLAALGSAGFAAGRDARLDLRVLSPAGPREVQVPVRTIRTTLRAVELRDLRPGLAPAIGAIRLVPVTGPGVGRVFKDPVPPEVAGRARFRPSLPSDVRNVPDVYLQDAELSRAEYFAIVDAGLARVASLSSGARAALVAADDPLGEARLSPAGFTPHGRLAGDRHSTQPIAGIDFHQAVAVVRLLGLLVADEPDFVRLPLGVELELAAFGVAELDGLALHGAAVRGEGIDAAAVRALAVTLADPARWPPPREVAVALGDLVRTELGDRILGLDLGVREWVLDLPCPPPDARGRPLVLEWRADHARHLERIHDAATRGVRDELDVFIANRAILRGSASGEDPTLPIGSDGRVPRGWPGVVRELQLRRDGVGLVPGAEDPHLALAGLRIAGGEAFVTEVRSR